MEIKDMTIEDLEARKLEISAASDDEGADMAALLEEIRNINAELEERKAQVEARKAEEAQKAELRKLVAQGAGQPIKEIKEEKNIMTIEEVRSSKEYVEAFARYIKSEDDRECRTLLTVNGDPENGINTIPVPTIIEERIRTNWEKMGLLALIRKTYVKGTLQVAFEASATGANYHMEGAERPAEEELMLGIVTLPLGYIKKWVKVTDLALETGFGGAEAFLYYIYDEITYQIAKLAEDTIVGMVATMPDTVDVDHVSVAHITSDGSDMLAIVAQAIANLSDEATNPVIVMNKLSYAAFRSAQLSAQYAVDPFEGLPIYYNSTLKAVDSAAENEPWLIVGDFSRGMLGNFPNGTDIRVDRDDLSLSEYNIVKFVGKLLCAIGVVADKCFTVVEMGEGGADEGGGGGD